MYTSTERYCLDPMLYKNPTKITDNFIHSIGYKYIDYGLHASLVLHHIETTTRREWIGIPCFCITLSSSVNGDCA